MYYLHKVDMMGEWQGNNCVLFDLNEITMEVLQEYINNQLFVDRWLSVC